jgi:hypothetical protein
LNGPPACTSDRRGVIGKINGAARAAPFPYFAYVLQADCLPDLHSGIDFGLQRCGVRLVVLLFGGGYGGVQCVFVI